jgi:hypothetical protein
MRASLGFRDDSRSFRPRPEDGYSPPMAIISVLARDDKVFIVTVTDGASSTTHEVTVWPSDLERYAPDATPEELIEASFEFLLEREPKESILRRFELPIIERYFPEYGAAMRAQLSERESS